MQRDNSTDKISTKYKKLRTKKRPTTICVLHRTVTCSANPATQHTVTGHALIKIRFQIKNQK